MALAIAAVASAQSSPSIHILAAGDRIITYEIRDGYAVTQGDILLGTAEELAEASGLPDGARASAGYLFGTGLPSLWPNATLYYTIDADIPDPGRITAAIDHWTSHTPLHIEAHGGQANYVRFQRAGSTGACSSFIGMRGQEQIVSVPDDCPSGSLIHEIGHAFGLLHEQERIDRNTYITLLYPNIDKRYLSNFEGAPPLTSDLGYYDFDSIMHYPAAAFSINQFDTIETVPVGIPIGQRTALSAGDIDGVVRLYGMTPSGTTVTTVPAGLTIVVDGNESPAPQTFNWAPGSTHTISAPQETGDDPLHRFAFWSDGGERTHDVTASGDTTVFAANFQRLHPVKISVGRGTGDATLEPPAADGNYPERLPLRIAATPRGTAEFFNWSGRPSVSSNGYGFSTGQAVVEVTTTNAEFVANFITPPTALIDSEPRGLSILIDGTAYRTPVKFAWDPGTDHALVALPQQSGAGGTAIFTFDNWSDGGEASHPVTAPAGPVTYMATYRASYLLSTFATGSGSLRVSPPSGNGFYDAGTEVEISASGSFGSELQYWSGDLSGGGASRNLVISGAKSVTGHFGPHLDFTVFNAGSFAVHPMADSPVAGVAPGELVTIFSGLTIGPGSLATYQIDSNGRFTTELEGTRILFDGQPAPLVYVKADQASAIVPAAVAGHGSTKVQIERNGQIIASQSIGVVETFPAMFTSDSTGKGQIAALNQDGSKNSAANPVAAGQAIVIYATGAGLMNGSLPDGVVTGSDLQGARAPVYVRLGKVPAQVIYAGTAPGLVNGVLQVNAIVSPDTLSGPDVPIQLIVGTWSSLPGTTVAVK